MIFVACLWSTFLSWLEVDIVMICLAQDVSQVTFWESLFLVFAVAFTLQEYTAFKEYGWTSQYTSHRHILDSDEPRSLHC